MRRLCGFSLIELMVALVLLGVGIAGTARASLAIARLDRASDRRRRAVAQRRARLDSLAVMACVASQSGEAADADLVLHWDATPQDGAWMVTLVQQAEVSPSASRLDVRVPCP